MALELMGVSLLAEMAQEAERSHAHKPSNCSPLTPRAVQSFSLAQSTPGLNPHTQRIDPGITKPSR